MSIPIVACRISRAALGDEDEFNKLVTDMTYNIKWGAYSRYPCRCDPPCPIPTDEQLKEFSDRMNAALKGVSLSKEG